MRNRDFLTNFTKRDSSKKVQVHWHLRESKGPSPFLRTKTHIYERNIQRLHRKKCCVRTCVVLYFWEFLGSCNHHDVKNFRFLNIDTGNSNAKVYKHILHTHIQLLGSIYKINFFWHKIWNTKIMLLNSFISDYKQKSGKTVI